MVRLTRAFAASLVALSTLLPAIRALTTGFPYETQKIRGVNLGGWLVLEPWITPSLFDNTGNPKIIDEWTFGQYQDHDVALATLEEHWNTWITEQDFEEIAAAGLNHVRLPIGYWAFETSAGEPYVKGQLPYLRKAVNWARKRDLKVIVDLHGAPGSQNGFDNSGQKKDYPQWHTAQSNVDRSNAIIEQIAFMFKDQTGVVAAIAPLNEPAGFKGQDVIHTTKQYWKDSYERIRNPKGQPGNAVSVIHDAFQPLDSWNNFMTAPHYQGVVLDTHHYQIFSPAENQWSQSQHIRAACDFGNSLHSSERLAVVVGEWTPSMTDCAKYLNSRDGKTGRDVGSRYDGSYPGTSQSRVGSCDGLTGKASTFSSSYKTSLAKTWEAQAMSFEKSQGWIQWTWKAENADEWSYKAGLAYGWIPQNPTNYQYPHICD